MPEYTLYGLVVRSNRSLDGLDVAPVGSDVDVQITLDDGAPPHPEAADLTPYHAGGAHADSEALVRRDGEGNFWFRYTDETCFLLDRDATSIRAWWASSSTLEDTATYLLGPVLGFALRRRGVLALHASAVLIGGRAVAFLGRSGAGKSTTAAAFAAAGVPVLSDDVVAVRMIGGEATVFPSYRLLRLWDESEKILFGTVGELPKLTPTWDKRALPLGAAFPFHAAPAPLGDVFLIAPRTADEQAPYVETMRPHEAFMNVVVNTYANYLLDDAMRGQELHSLEAVLRGRRVRRLVPHASPGRLDALVRCVHAAVAEPSSD